MFHNPIRNNLQFIVSLNKICEDFVMKLILLDSENTEEKNQFLETLLAHYKGVPYLPSLDIFTKEKRFYWATVEDKRVGVSGYHLKTLTLAETIKTIILPEYQGKGYGQELSQAIEDECRENGIKKVISTIYADNIKMISIKLKQGYKIEGYHPDHEAPGWHEYSLGKLLV